MYSVPKDLQRLVAEIDGWLDLRCPDKALERLPPVLERKEARAAGLALRIRAYAATKQHEKAMQDLEELRAAPPGLEAFDPDIGVDAAEWLDLTEAWCRKRLNDLPGAIHCMEQLLRRNPRSAIGHFNLGCYLALAGDPERALDQVTLACGIKDEFREMLTDEPDLETLQRDPRFLRLAGVRSPADRAEDDAAEDALEEDVLAGFGTDIDFDAEDDPFAEFDDEIEDDPDDDENTAGP